MRRAFLSLLAGGLLLHSQPAAAPRPELTEPPICSTLRAGTAPATACTVTTRTDGSGTKDIELTLKAAKAKVKVGGYLVESENYNATYIAPLVETAPGSVLNINLTDTLPAGAAGDNMTGHTNLHTHGLLVSPQNEFDSFGKGDNVLVDVASGGTFRFQIPIPTALAAGILDNPKPIQHPDGLYWYHPHIHGTSKEQVSGGMAGVISIGRGSELLTVNGANGQLDTAATAALRAHTDVRYLELKDLQVTTSVSPERATGSSPATWNSDSDPAFCGTVDPNQASNGYYRQAVAKGTPTPPGGRPLWLFTINGQRYPRIGIGAGRNHLWRIANLSATVTYVLQLLDQGKPVPFEVMSVDGVVAGSAAEQSGSVSGIKKTTLLLMPAGRAEILVRNDGSNPGPERNLVLQTAGINTGPDGDVWPKVNLAEVHVAKTSAANASAARSLLPSASSGSNVQPVSRGGTPNTHTPGNACTRSVLKPGEWRRITFSQNDTAFFIGSEIANAQGPSSDVLPPASFPMGLDWDTAQHVCVSLGESEIWEIDNTAQELHNFHIHQTKFRLARPDELKKLGLTTSPFVDPTGAFAKLGLDVADESSSGGTVWHDTLPVPLAAPNGSPGKIFIAINFKAPEQIGRYVFHCHILEHEDKGMMAPIEVLRAGQ